MDSNYYAIYYKKIGLRVDSANCPYEDLICDVTSDDGIFCYRSSDAYFRAENGKAYAIYVDSSPDEDFMTLDKDYILSEGDMSKYIDIELLKNDGIAKKIEKK